MTVELTTTTVGSSDSKLGTAASVSRMMDSGSCVVVEMVLTTTSGVTTEVPVEVTAGSVVACFHNCI